MAFEFHDLGFKRLYDVEIRAEHPSHGRWPFRSFQFGDKGNDTATIKVRPEHGRTWTASFSLEVGGVITGVYSCPNPDHLLVATGSDAYLLSADQPAVSKALPVHPVTMVARSLDKDLVLVGSFTGLVAIDKVGVRWAAPHLFLDDLELVESTPHAIQLQGRDRHAPDRPANLWVDVATGHVLSR